MIYFVTEEWLKGKTHITQNVDAQDLAPYLELSAITYLVPILGHNFYNELLIKYNNGTTNVDEDLLIEYIRPVVGFYSAYEAVPNLSYRISNKGIQSQFGEYSGSEGLVVLDYIRRNILKFCKLNENNLRTFLKENKDKYSGYTNNNKNIISPDKKDRGNITGFTAI